MIWHFFEVWILMLAAFAIGCPLGALAYGLIARSPLADVQGTVADRLGDVVDGLKSRLGIGPVWRPEYRRIIERPEAETRPAEGAMLAAGEPAELFGRESSAPGDDADWLDEEQGDSRREQRTRGRDDVIDVEPVADVHGPATPPVSGEESPVDGVVPMRPAGLAAPRNGVPDDLQRIRGIGARNEQRLNSLGIFHFGQIAAWTPAEIRWVAQQLAFPERIERDDWVGQAIVLASGGDTGFTKSADRRRARRQRAFDEESEGAFGDEEETAPAPEDFD